jgi:hypothetical protein
MSIPLDVRVAAEEARELRIKFHTRHMLEKDETDRFDTALDHVLSYIENTD